MLKDIKETISAKMPVAPIRTALITITAFNGGIKQFPVNKKSRCLYNGTKLQNRTAIRTTYPLVSGLYRRRLNFTDSASNAKTARLVRGL